MNTKLRNLILKLGIFKTILLLTFTSILCSVSISVTARLFFGKSSDLTYSIIISMIIPALVVPALSYGVIRLLNLLATSEKTLEHRIKELKKTKSQYQDSMRSLQEEIKRRKILMDESPDGIAIINQEHRVIETNNRFAQMLGYSPQELLHLHTWDWEAISSEAEIRSTYDNLSETKTSFETVHRRKDGTSYKAEVTACGAMVGGKTFALAITRDITKKKQLREEREQLIKDLKDALANVKTLQGLIPICSACKKIRDDKGYWEQIESYIGRHSDTEFSHSLCPECSEKFYGDEEWYKKRKKKKSSEPSDSKNS